MKCFLGFKCVLDVCVSAVLIVKEEVSEEEGEEKRTSDNESEESTEDERLSSDPAVSGSDRSPPEGAAETSVRKRKPPASDPSEET